MAGMYEAWSSYNYVMGNPVIHTDPDGRSVNNGYVRDNNTGETTQVSTVGGDEFDLVYSGTVNDDGSVTIDNTDPEVIDVHSQPTGEMPYFRGPGVMGIPGQNVNMQTMDGADDPIFNLLTLGAGSRISKSDDVIDVTLSLAKKAGRQGKNAKLRELAEDDKLGKADRGWLRQELNEILRGKRMKGGKGRKKKHIRNPPGKDLAHERGRESAKGFSYYWSKLQDRVLHRRQHKHDNYGKKNKRRPPPKQ